MRLPLQVDRDQGLKNHLTVRGKMFQMGYPLPTGIGTRSRDGYVKLLDLPVSANLTRQSLLKDFVVGGNTPLKSGMRPFIERWGRVWHVRMGQICVECSTSQAEEACACVDVITQSYQEELRNATTLLDLWNYPTISSASIEGVLLLAVPTWLWDAMLDCSFAFTHDSGNSPMHVFDGSSGYLGIRRAGKYMSAALWPVFNIPSLPDGFVGLIYEYPDLYLRVFEEHEQDTWKEHIGESGFWTASYTETWLVEHFIPLTLSLYGKSPHSSVKPQRLRDRLALALLSNFFDDRHQQQLLIHRTRDTRHLPFATLNDAKELIPYVEDLQRWFHNYPITSLSASLLRPYYRTMTELAHHTDTDCLDLEYELDLVGFASSDQPDTSIEETGKEGKSSPRSPREQLLHQLDLHIARITEQDYELHQQADFLTCAWLSLLRKGHLRCSPVQLAQAVATITPLWEQCRFECRYCLS